MNDDKIVIELPDKLRMIEQSAKWHALATYIWKYTESLILVTLLAVLLNYIISGIDIRIMLTTSVIVCTIMSLIAHRSCVKYIDSELHEMNSSMKEQLILDTKNKCLELTFDGHAEYGSSKLRLNNLKAIKYFKRDRILYAKADYGELTVNTMEYTYRSTYNLIDGGVLLRDLTIPIEKLGNSMINNGVDINIEDKTPRELFSLRVDVKKICEIIDTGECIYKNTFKGKCSFCSLADGCDSKESNTDNQCNYWRCKFRESTDRCLVENVMKK